MTDFIVPLPDGRKIKVDAENQQQADDAAKNFLMREAKPAATAVPGTRPFQSQPAPSVVPDPGIAKATEAGKAGGLDNWLRSYINMPAFSTMDEAKAAVQSKFPGVIDFLNRDLFTGEVKNPTPRGPSAYDTILGEDRAQSKAYAEEYPWWDTSAKLAGTVTGLSALKNAPVVGPLITGSSPRLVGGTLRSGATGGGLSALEGFGAGEGGFDERTANAGKHGIVGTAGGLALHPLLMGGGALTNALLEGPGGRFVADKVAGPAVRMMGDVVDKFAPRVKPADLPKLTLSSAAPEGGALPVVDSVTGRVAEAIRGAAPNSEEILANAAARRIATAMQRGGTDVPGFKLKMDELGPGAVPGDVNPMTQRQIATVYNTPGPAPKIVETNLGARDRETGDRVVGSVRKAMGNSDEAVLEAQRLQGLRAGGSNYDDAIGPNAKYVVSPEMRQIMQETPAIRAAMDKIEKDAAHQGVTLTPAQIAHRVKRQLAADADAAYGGRGLAPNKADVGSTAERWRTALHEANPAIKAADEAWEAGSKRIEALDLGRKFMASGTSETADAVSPAILEQRIPKMSAEEAQAFIDGAADTLITAAQSGPRQARAVIGKVEENQNLRRKIEAMIGEDNARILYNRAMSERTFAQTKNVGMGGSDTFRKTVAAADEAAMGDLPTTPTGLIQKGLASFAQWYAKQAAGNEAVRGQIAKMLTERDPVAQAELIKRIEAELGRQAQPRTLQRGVVPSLTGQVE
jgi:hypothetical protein